MFITVIRSTAVKVWAVIYAFILHTRVCVRSPRSDRCDPFLVHSPIFQGNRPSRISLTLTTFSLLDRFSSSGGSRSVATIFEDEVSYGLLDSYVTEGVTEGQRRPVAITNGPDRRRTRGRDWSVATPFVGKR